MFYISLKIDEKGQLIELHKLNPGIMHMNLDYLNKSNCAAYHNLMVGYYQ